MKKKKKGKPRQPTLARIERVCRNRGFTPRRVYVFDECVIFIDLGNLWVYVPSALTVSPGRTSLKVMQIDPVEELREQIIEQDELIYDQADRLLARYGGSGDDQHAEAVKDATILKENYVFTAARRRKWRTRASSRKLGLRVAVDLPRFMKYPNTFKKSRIAEIHLHMVVNIPVPVALAPRKKQYERYIDEVLGEMHKISAGLREEIEGIRDVREESGKNIKFVSIDIHAAHAVALHEKAIRNCNADQFLAKNLLKEGIANLAAFALEAEAAEHVLATTSEDVARASAQLSNLA